MIFKVKVGSYTYLSSKNKFVDQSEVFNLSGFVHRFQYL